MSTTADLGEYQEVLTDDTDERSEEDYLGIRGELAKYLNCNGKDQDAHDDYDTDKSGENAVENGENGNDDSYDENSDEYGEGELLGDPDINSCSQIMEQEGECEVYTSEITNTNHQNVGQLNADLDGQSCKEDEQDAADEIPSFCDQERNTNGPTQPDVFRENVGPLSAQVVELHEVSEDDDGEGRKEEEKDWQADLVENKSSDVREETQAAEEEQVQEGEAGDLHQDEKAEEEDEVVESDEYREAPLVEGMHDVEMKEKVETEEEEEETKGEETRQGDEMQTWRRDDEEEEAVRKEEREEELEGKEHEEEEGEQEDAEAETRGADVEQEEQEESEEEEEDEEDVAEVAEEQREAEDHEREAEIAEQGAEYEEEQLAEVAEEQEAEDYEREAEIAEQGAEYEEEQLAEVAEEQREVEDYEREAEIAEQAEQGAEYEEQLAEVAVEQGQEQQEQDYEGEAEIGEEEYEEEQVAELAEEQEQDYEGEAEIAEQGGEETEEEDEKEEEEKQQLQQQQQQQNKDEEEDHHVEATQVKDENETKEAETKTARSAGEAHSEMEDGDNDNRKLIDASSKDTPSRTDCPGFIHSDTISSWNSMHVNGSSLDTSMDISDVSDYTSDDSETRQDVYTLVKSDTEEEVDEEGILSLHETTPNGTADECTNDEKKEERTHDEKKVQGVAIKCKGKKFNGRPATSENRPSFNYDSQEYDDDEDGKNHLPSVIPQCHARDRNNHDVTAAVDTQPVREVTVDSSQSRRVKELGKLFDKGDPIFPKSMHRKDSCQSGDENPMSVLKCKAFFETNQYVASKAHDRGPKEDLANPPAGIVKNMRGMFENPQRNS